MPIKTPSNPPNPTSRLNDLRSPNTASFINNFFANGGTAVNDYGVRHSLYEPKPLNNSISAPGTIRINPHDATALANALPGTPYLNTYDSILLHELGHAFYATRVALDYQTEPAKIVEWCYNREALASFYVFNYLVERGISDGSMVVPGPGVPADLYSIIAAAVAGKTPGSLAYEIAALASARAKFASSPKYRQECTNFANNGGLPPAYYPPLPPLEGGGGGGGSGGGGAGIPKIPGGYWQEVPNTSD